MEKACNLDYVLFIENGGALPPLVHQFPYSMKKTISRAKAIEIIRSGKFCGVSFSTRRDNTPRKINCRFGVKSYRKGGELKYDPQQHGLTIVFDVQNKRYLSIPEERISTVNSKIVV